MKKKDLAWINGFVRKSMPHIFVREEDAVLILPPNRVYKLNETGLSLIRHCERGGRIEDAPGITEGERALEVHRFFTDLRAFFIGCTDDVSERKATETVRYGFDFTRLPILGEIALTYRCNNSCAFCYARCTPENNARELATADVKRIVDAFREKAKLPFFSFTGGEPLLRDDLEELVSYAVGSGLSVNLITNGTLVTPKRAKSLRKAGLKTAQVSIESPLREVHDALTRHNGSYDLTLLGIRRLLNNGISVQTNTTLNRLNAGSVASIPEFVSSFGIKRFSMNLFIPCGTGLDNAHLFIPYSEVSQYIETARKKAVSLGLVFYWYSPVPHCYYNPVAMGLGNKSCAAMDGLLSVSPDGTVLPCSSFPESMGNILENEFTDIWFSARAGFFKDKRFAPPECDGCDHFTACQSACPLYWAFNGTAELERIRAEKECIVQNVARRNVKPIEAGRDR